MAKKKRKAIHLTPEQQLEADYQKAIRRMNGADKMCQAKDRVQSYRQAMKMFQKLGNYGESELYKKWCKKSLPGAREQYRREVYQTGIQMKEHAKSALDYEEAITEFLKIKREYKDIPEQVAECKRLKQKAVRMEKNKEIIKKILTLAVVAAAAGLILYLRTPAASYQGAGILMSIKDYERASTFFARSAGYRDTAERRRECDYQRAGKAMQSHDFDKALVLLDTRVGDYKDALQKKAQCELEILKTAEAGDTVTFGTGRWIVAETAGEKVLLVRKKPAEEQVPYTDSGKDALWDQSGIRLWLNGQFYQENFSIYEQEAVLETRVVTPPNSKYGTKSGVETSDRVFLLSDKEADSYQKLLAVSDNQKPWWLRTSGKSADSAAFVSPAGDVMHYGYAVDSKEIAARPAVWVGLSGKP